MAECRLRLKFKESISNKQMDLLHKHGFTYFSRQSKPVDGGLGWIMYVKNFPVPGTPVVWAPKTAEDGPPTSYDPVTPSYNGDLKGDDFRGLPEATRADLNRRVNRIVSQFKEPEKYIENVKTRLRNMANTLEPRSRDWVLDWIKRVLEEDEE